MPDIARPNNLEQVVHHAVALGKAHPNELTELLLVKPESHLTVGAYKDERSIWSILPLAEDAGVAVTRLDRNQTFTLGDALHVGAHTVLLHKEDETILMSNLIPGSTALQLSPNVVAPAFWPTTRILMDTVRDQAVEYQQNCWVDSMTLQQTDDMMKSSEAQFLRELAGLTVANRYVTAFASAKEVTSIRAAAVALRQMVTRLYRSSGPQPAAHVTIQESPHTDNSQILGKRIMDQVQPPYDLEAIDRIHPDYLLRIEQKDSVDLVAVDGMFPVVSRTPDYPSEHAFQSPGEFLCSHLSGGTYVASEHEIHDISRTLETIQP